MRRFYFLLTVFSAWMMGTIIANPAESLSHVQEASEAVLKETFSHTQGSILIGGEEVSYSVNTGNLILQDPKGKDKGSVFFVAYHRQNISKEVRRPLLFCTNGGPGSSAAWLHLGLLGPKRIVCDDKGVPLSPFELIDNEYSILDAVDLIFIDPISTGFSRAAPGENETQFHGVDQDAKWIGEFIRLYLSRFGGWEGPFFFIGESYGSTRAAVLATSLMDQQRIYLDRIVLISSVLNFQTFGFGSGNDLPYLTSLPSYTAAAWFHQKLPETQLKKPLKELLKEAEAFTISGYNVALMRGDSLSLEEKQKIADQLVSYTGLEKKFLLQSDLRVTTHRFRQELLRAEQKVIGRFDSRYAGTAENPTGCTPTYDPSFEVLFGPFNAAINAYLRKDLKWESAQNYELLAEIWPWKFSDVDNHYLDASESLRTGMIRNPRLKVFVASGVYDLAVPYFSTAYTFNHLGLKDRISLYYYPGGHMMYLELSTLKKLSAQLREFLR